ncbi:helix-turn-helix domain-containing protein [Streptomyces sp. WAC07061]|uniref:helix-turn-helix domain-containing protein n=1 Tax=Streptomyces sp. WAC07061 TaxID=2487410 RepID=UPI000F769F14|nr:helix-turn-helix domain-containing protein [Streptomyces sp. WAC07061]RSS51760.1 helix-turn-helix domain-containing protein [Streptomyces sp. WAC07061]
MTTAHQQTIPRQAALPAARVSRRLRSDLPEPGERRRLREQWGLSTRQVAVAFGVTPATVRSWERGRSTPRGGRKEAYQQFLAGLAQHGGMPRPGAAVRARRRRRPAPPTAVAGVQPGPQQTLAPPPTCAAAPLAGGVVRVGGAVPLEPERVRRLRLLGAAACVWSLALWVILTCPVPL